MAKDKLTLTTVEGLSEAIAVHVKLPGIKSTEVTMAEHPFLEGDKTYWWVVATGKPFNITDPRHWVMVVEAMREKEWYCTTSNHIDMQANFFNLQITQPMNFGMPVLFNGQHETEMGIAVCLAALAAHGIDCEWKPEGDADG